jgi:hypothetical protein
VLGVDARDVGTLDRRTRREGRALGVYERDAGDVGVHVTRLEPHNAPISADDAADANDVARGRCVRPPDRPPHWDCWGAAGRALEKRNEKKGPNVFLFLPKRSQNLAFSNDA